MISGEWLVLAAVALLVGFFIGTTGVGGVLLIPALTWFGGVPLHQASATVLLSFLFIGIWGTRLFQRRGSIDWKITPPLLGGALVFAYLGARANALIDAQVLAPIIGLLIFFAGAYVIYPHRHGDAVRRDGRSRAQQLLLAVIGAVAGFGSGLSGAGGPVFSSPMLLAAGFAPLAVVGAGQVMLIVVASFGTLGNLQSGSIDFALAGWITLFELAGAMAGAHLAHAISGKALRQGVAGLCMLTGLMMLARTL